MKKIVLNYRVLIEKELDENKKPVFVSLVPTLGISDFGPSLEKVLENTEKLIKFHLECLIEEKKAIPQPDNPQSVIVLNQEVEIASKDKLSFA